MNAIKPYYPILEAKIAESGITKKYIANKLEITPRALSCKLKGKTDWWLNEAKIIHSIFLDVTIEELFSH